jgi:hypothetical protein
MSFPEIPNGSSAGSPDAPRCCVQAEAYGVLLYCNSFSRREIKIVTESDAFAARLPLLFRKAFRSTSTRRPGMCRKAHLCGYRRGKGGGGLGGLRL